MMRPNNPKNPKNNNDKNEDMYYYNLVNISGILVIQLDVSSISDRTLIRGFMAC